MVNFHVRRNHRAEHERLDKFMRLQQRLVNDFTKRPEPPKIAEYNTTQTAVVLELVEFDMKNATLRRVDVFRNNQLVTGGSVVVRTEERRVKLSGLEESTTYESRWDAVTRREHLCILRG